MINRFTVLLFFMPFLFSCKKGNSPTNTSNPVNNGWYGIFEVGKIQTQTGIQLTTQYVSNAYFSSSPQSYGNTATAVRVDSVKVNGMPLMFSTYDSTYNDTSGFATGIQQPIIYPYTYKIVGKNTIPSFSYTENGPFPDYNGLSAWPDTIFRSKGFSIALSGITNADNISVIIQDGSGKEVSQTFFYPIPLTTNFTASMLSQVDTSSSGFIELVIIKMDNKTMNGKPMAFNMASNFTKTIWIK